MQLASLCPQAKTSLKCVAVVAYPALWGQLFQFLRVAAPQNHFVGLESRNELGNHVRDMAPPLLLALLQQRLVAYMAFVRPLLVRKVTQFHGLHNAVGNQGRSETGS